MNKQETLVFTIEDVPRDGSCFFTCVANSLAESVGQLEDFECLRSILEHRWEEYAESRIDPPMPDQQMVRHMCSQGIDESVLEQHNQDAEADHRQTFRSVEELKNHVRTTNCWADFSLVRAFMNSVQYRLAVLIFDVGLDNVVFMPPEWTFNKDLYVIIRRDNCHYSSIRILRGTQPLPLMVQRDVVREIMTKYDPQSCCRF